MSSRDDRRLWGLLTLATILWGVWLVLAALHAIATWPGWPEPCVTDTQCEQQEKQK